MWMKYRLLNVQLAAIKMQNKFGAIYKYLCLTSRELNIKFVKCRWMRFFPGGNRNDAWLRSGSFVITLFVGRSFVSSCIFPSFMRSDTQRGALKSAWYYRYCMRWEKRERKKRGEEKKVTKDIIDASNNESFDVSRRNRQLWSITAIAEIMQPSTTLISRIISNRR